MPETQAGAEPVRGAGKLKVFLSYSRKDSAFATELLQSLELLGFEAFLDKEDIAPGEPWEDRLGSLIRIADTVVFVVSPNSIASKHCGWEVEETIRKAKRLVPVILAEVPSEQVPAQLRRLNYVYFSHGRSFAKGLAELAQALRENVGWIREHTRIGEMALRWQERGKLEPLLLRGSDLEEALAWQAKRPDDAPEITAVQHAFIAASEAAAAEALRQAARLRWRVQIGLAIAAALSLGAAVFAGLQWREADIARTSLAARNEELAEANFRLRRPISLRVAPLGNEPYDLGSNWYRAATTYTGAVAYLVRNAKPEAMFSSGALVEARALNPAWGPEPVFVTAIYAVSRHGKIEATSGTRLAPSPAAGRTSGYDGAIFGSDRPQDVSIVLLTPGGEMKRLPLTETIWQSETLGISVNRIAGELPKGTTVLKDVMSDMTAMGPVEPDGKFARPPMITGEAMFLKPTSGPLRPLVSAGNVADRPEVTLLIHHFVGRTRFEPNQMRRFATDVVYTQAALPGSSGSPVFDVTTGQLVAFHLMKDSDCPKNASDLEAHVRLCLGSGTTIERIIAAIAADAKSH